MLPCPHTPCLPSVTLSLGGHPLGTYQEPSSLVVQGHVYLGHAVPYLEGVERLGHAPRSRVPTEVSRQVWVPQRPSHPSQVGTSVMAIFFLSKDSRICCSSFWGGAQRGHRQGQWGQLLPPRGPRRLLHGGALPWSGARGPT